MSSPVIRRRLGGTSDQGGGGAAAPSPYYTFFLPANQIIGSGDVVDESGNGNDAVLQGSVSEATFWGTSGRFVTTGNGTPPDGDDTGCEMAVGSFPWNLLAGDSFIFHMLLNKASSADLQNIIGTQITTNKQGLLLRQQSSGTLGINIRDGSNPSVTALLDDVKPCDGTDHLVTVAVDGSTSELFGWVDGALDSGVNGVSLAAIDGTTTPTLPFSFGSGAGASSPCYAMEANNIHGLVFPARGLPLDMNAIVAKLNATPGTMLTTDDVV